MRVVSLLPSATEIVYALGLGESLVGVTFECDVPAFARVDCAVVVGGLATGGLTPGEIDALVRDRVASGKDVYTLDERALSGLDPDVILTQDLCRVCAVPSGQVDAALDHLGCHADVLSLDPHSLEDVLASIEAVGVRLDAPARADSLVGSLRARLAVVRRQVTGRRRPRVAVVEWVDPPFCAGHWVPDLVLAAGGEPAAAAPGGRSVETTWDAIIAAHPDLVLVAPCGFRLDAAVEQAATVTDLIPEIPVWAIDADGLVVRPGPRLVDGVEAIAAVLHPDAMPAPGPGRVARIR